MKTIHFLLLIALLISIIYSILYMFDNNFSSVKTCNQVWDELTFKGIDGRTLEEVFDFCLQENFMSKGSSDRSDNYHLSKRSLITFNCSRTLRTLNVPRPYVALASCPGSGNTWTRFLVEAATGIETGSVYNDPVFAGSKFCPARGKVFIVKTHRTDSSLVTHIDCRMLGITSLQFSSAIYIIRNPFNVFLAEFNRPHMNGFKLSNAPKESFNTTKWRKFVYSSAYNWKVMTLKWLNRKDIPVFVLIYEKIIENVILEIFKLTKFLNYTMKFEDAYCLSSERTRQYQRNKPAWISKENLYSNELRKVVNSAVKYVKYNIHSKWNILDVLDSYILLPDKMLK